MGWIVTGLLIISGMIASLFIPKTALNFQIIQMVIAVILFSLIMIVIAFWSSLVDVFQRFANRKK